MRKEKAITLIALVITIIILLILAGISIATLTGENGILTKADTAKEKHIIEQYKEEITLSIAEEVAERKIEKKDELMIVSLDKKIRQKEWVNEIYKCNSSGEEQPIFESSTHLLVESKEHYEFLIEVNEEKETAKIVSSIKGTGENYQITYNPNGGTGVEETVEIRQGFSTTLKECNYTKEQYKFVGWSENQNGEGERLLGGSNYKPTKKVILYAIWEPTTIKEAKEAGTILSTTQNKILKDDIGNSIVLPAGFKVGSESANSVIDGVVIEDVSHGVTAGSEFVWIPVADETPYERNRSYAMTGVSAVAYDDTNYLPDGITNEEQAVRNAKGFYISRYEAGKEGTNTLVSKKGSTVWDNITQENSKATAKTMYKENTYVKSALISGIQWDMVMSLITSKPRVDGTNKTYDVTVVDNRRHKGESVGMEVSGNNEADKVCNIYDLEGNAWEYVAEKNTYSPGLPFVNRGTSYSDRNRYSASYRSHNYGYADNYGSFRIALYVIQNSI